MRGTASALEEEHVRRHAAYGEEGVRFYTKQKSIMRAGPRRSSRAAEFVMATSGVSTGRRGVPARVPVGSESRRSRPRLRIPGGRARNVLSPGLRIFDPARPARCDRSRRLGRVLYVDEHRRQSRRPGRAGDLAIGRPVKKRRTSPVERSQAHLVCCRALRTRPCTSGRVGVGLYPQPAALHRARIPWGQPKMSPACCPFDSALSLGGSPASIISPSASPSHRSRRPPSSARCCPSRCWRAD